MSDESSGAGAPPCAQHPEQAASGVCPTCGRNTCEACGPGPQCPGCRAPLPSTAAAGAAGPLPRTRPTFSELWTVSQRAFEREWLMLSLGVLLTGVVPFAVSLVSTVVAGVLELMDLKLAAIAFQVMSGLLQLLLQAALTLGLMHLVLEALQGRRVDVAQLLKPLRGLPQYLLAWLIMLAVALPVAGVLVGLGFLGYQQELLHTVPEWVVAGGLVSVGLFWATLPLMFLPAEFARDPSVGALESLRTCYRLAAGQRLLLLGVVLVSAGLGVVGFMLCCVGVLPAYAFSQLLLGALYLALLGPAEPRP